MQEDLETAQWQVAEIESAFGRGLTSAQAPTLLEGLDAIATNVRQVQEQLVSGSLDHICSGHDEVS
jgi:hypothetical protein